MGLTAIPQNYKKNVDWIIGAYSDAGVSFPNGFQKDAIQNAAGARRYKSWKDWGCDISLIETSKGSFLVVEDFGTVGLTGSNMPAEVVYEKMANDEVLPVEERLSRFTSMFNSGGNVTGGGLYGAGKSVYSVASETYTYYFDSLRADGLYVANVNKGGQVNSVAFEGQEAKDYILENTGLSEKTSVGTRVIIESPKRELVDSIVGGEIVPYIQESWWLIMQRLPEDSSITVNGVPVTVPKDIKNARFSYELKNSEIYVPDYKVKHFELYVFPDGGNIWTGISYYRKGMKIGDIDIKDVPKKVDGKFWGYVEVDEPWEDNLAEIEDKVHFGVSKGKKGTSAYRHLRSYCQDKFQEKMVDWGYVKNKEYFDKRLHDDLKKIAEDVQGLFDKLGYEDLGRGPRRPDFDIRLQDVEYPDDGTETVTANDHIRFSVRISSSYSRDKTFRYELHVVNPKTGDVVSKIKTKNDKITLRPNTVERLDFDHVVTTDNSERFAKNKLVLTVKVVGSGKQKKKELPYFFDMDKPDNSKDAVLLNLHECTFPRENSRRIDFDESLKNVSYLIENKRNYELKYKLSVSIYHEATNFTILNLEPIFGEVAPFEDVVTPSIAEIVFDKKRFEPHLSDGILELRAKLSANEDDVQYEKGDKITYYHYKVFFNMDEKNGHKDAFDVQSVKAPDDFRRSWFSLGGGRTISINVSHASYMALQDYPDLQYQYMREQMLKQYVLLYLAEGKYDMFMENGKDFSNLEPQEAVEQVLRKIESIYNLSLE